MKKTHNTVALLVILALVLSLAMGLSAPALAAAPPDLTYELAVINNYGTTGAGNLNGNYTPAEMETAYDTGNNLYKAEPGDTIVVGFLVKNNAGQNYSLYTLQNEIEYDSGFFTDVQLLSSRPNFTTQVSQRINEQWYVKAADYNIGALAPTTLFCVFSLKVRDNITGDHNGEIRCSEVIGNDNDNQSAGITPLNLTVYTGTYVKNWNVDFLVSGDLSAQKPDSMIVTDGETINLPVLTRENYRFNGWLYNGEVYTGSFEVTESVDFTADWTPYPVVTYDLRGGSMTAGTEYICKDVEETITLPRPVYTPNKFLGWRVKGTENEPMAAGTQYHVTENVELAAVWGDCGHERAQLPASQWSYSHIDNSRRHRISQYISGQCPDCGFELSQIQEPIEDCDYQNTWVRTATDHYHICKACGDIEDRAAHTFSNGYCTVCGRADPNYAPVTSDVIDETQTALPIDAPAANTPAVPSGGTMPSGATVIDEEEIPLSELGAAISTVVGDPALTADAARNVDGSITITVTDAAGQRVDKADGGVKVVSFGVTSGQVVALLDETGAIKEYIKKSLVEDGVAYALVDGSSTIRIADNAKTFTDVSAADWFQNAVIFVSSHELFNGFPAGDFQPNTNMNRAMLVTVLHRLEGTPATAEGLRFSDVAADAYYAEAVKWAAANGIVKGYEDGTFRPDQNVTRQEMAAFLFRYMTYLAYDVSQRGDLSAFADGEETADWAAENLSWANGAGIITGRDGNLVAPLGTATRAEVATMLMRLITGMVK